MSDICAELHHALRALERHRFPFDPKLIPSNGLYVLFEKGETGHGGDRVVRVGTHTGEAQLRSRLKQHFITPSKDRSIFRKNIGRALLNRDHDPFIREWEFDLTTRKAKDEFGSLVDFKKQTDVERQVSVYIQERFEFVVIAEAEKSARLDLEAKMVATVSLCGDCEASAGWLGLSSPKDKIRESGLWQVNELYGEGLSVSDIARILTGVTN